MVKIRSKIKFLETSFFYELVKLETLKKIFVMCHSIFALPIPPPGTPLGQNENEDAVPRVGILFFVQFPERGKILQ